MRDDFAVFILTHGRADNVVTLKSLLRGGYTGRWYMVIDDEDDDAEKYQGKYGADHVIMFDKQAAYTGQIRWTISIITVPLSMREMSRFG